MIMFLEFSFYHELVKYVCQLKNKNNRSLSKIQSRETVHRKVIYIEEREKEAKWTVNRWHFDLSLLFICTRRVKNWLCVSSSPPPLKRLCFTAACFVICLEAKNLIEFPVKSPIKMLKHVCGALMFFPLPHFFKICRQPFFKNAIDISFYYYRLISI